jgi:O-antigen/teichoic acid export membrane protein
LLRRAIWPLAIKALPALYGAGLVLFVIRILPAEEFGKYGIAFAYINLCAVFPRGLWIIPMIALNARGESAEITGSTLWMSLATAAVGALGAIAVLPLLGVTGHTPLLAAAAIMLLTPREVGFGLAQARGNYETAFVIDSIYFIGSLMLFGLLWFLPEWRTADWAITLNVMSLIASVAYGTFVFPHMWRTFVVRSWRTIFEQGRWVGILGLGEVYMQQGDVLVLSAFVTPAEIAPYVAARTLLRMYAIISQSVSLVVLPVSSRLSATMELAKLRHRMIAVFSTMLKLLVPINVMAWLLAGSVLPILLGAKYRSAIPFFNILLIATFLEPFYSVLGNALVGIRKAERVVGPLLICVALSIVCNIALVQFIGIMAAPIVVVASYLLLAVFIGARANLEIR